MAMFGLDREAVDRTSHLTVIGDRVNTATLQAMPATVGRGAWQRAPSPGQTTLKFPTSRHFIGNNCAPDPVSSIAALRRHESGIFGCCGTMAIPN
jgi:hypothetical protein